MKRNHGGHGIHGNGTSIRVSGVPCGVDPNGIDWNEGGPPKGGTTYANGGPVGSFVTVSCELQELNGGLGFWMDSPQRRKGHQGSEFQTHLARLCALRVFAVNRIPPGDPENRKSQTSSGFSQRKPMISKRRPKSLRSGVVGRGLRPSGPGSTGSGVRWTTASHQARARMFPCGSRVSP